MFIKRYGERGDDPNNKPRPGRPKKISQETADAIAIRLSEEPDLSKLSLCDLPELRHVYSRTVDRMLCRKGIRKWMARKRPKLLPRHAVARLAWALERKDWTIEQWKKHIWSDECSVQRGGSGVKWIWRMRGEDRYEQNVVDACK